MHHYRELLDAKTLSSESPHKRKPFKVDCAVYINQKAVIHIPTPVSKHLACTSNDDCKPVPLPVTKYAELLSRIIKDYHDHN